MAELSEQLRTYFDLTTDPVDVDEIVAIPHASNGRPAGNADPRRNNVMTIHLENRPDQHDNTPERPRRSLVALAFAAAAAIVLVIALVVANGDGTEQEPLIPATEIPPDGDAVDSPEDGDAAVPDAEPAPPSAPPAPSTEEVLRAYESAVNARDLDAVMALWADDGVLRGSPLGGDASGSVEIERVETQQIFQMSELDEQTYWVTGLGVDGDVATLGHIWIPDVGTCFAGTGDRVVVQDGLITEWIFGTSGEPCVRELLQQADDILDGTPSLVASLFVSDGEVVNHPFDNMVPIQGDDDEPIDDPAIGRAAVRDVFGGLFPEDVPHSLRNLEVDGPEATFDLITGDEGSRCTGFGGQRVVAEGGRIVLWDIGTDLGQIPCE